MFNEITPRTDIEEIILGSILVNEKILDDVFESLSPEHFLSPLHRLAYSTVFSIFLSGARVSSFMLCEKAQDARINVSFVQRLENQAVHPRKIKEYIDILIEHYKRNALRWIGQNMAIAPEDVSADEDILSAMKQLEDIQQNNKRESSFKTGYEAGTEYIKQVEAYLKSDEKIRGVTTGFDQMDMWFSGLQASNLYILAGRPAMGKTAFALQIAQNAVTAGTPTLIFSLEMPTDQLIGRMINSACEIEQDEIDKKTLTPNQHQSLVEYALSLNQSPIYFDDTPALTLSNLCLTARAKKRKHNIGLIIVDYLQIIQHNVQNPVERVTQISNKLKSLARELKIPVIALAQLSREVEKREDKRPMLADLRESGAIEQDADAVMLMYRHEYYIREHQNKQDELDACRGKAEVIVAKNRHGKAGTIHFNFMKKFGQFSESENN